MENITPYNKSENNLNKNLPSKPSIAILPFSNMSNDEDQEYFCDGITEDVITELSRFDNIFVISRNTSFTYKNKTVDLKTIAKELSVQYFPVPEPAKVIFVKVQSAELGFAARLSLPKA